MKSMPLLTFSTFLTLLLALLLPAGAVEAMLSRDEVNIDGGGGGGGGYYQQTNVQVPEITPDTGADIDITGAINGNGSMSSRQYSVQLNKTLWYAWNRWASGCGSTTGCLPTSDTSTMGWVSGLSNPNITIGYDIGVYDATTNAPYAENASIPTGTAIKLVFGPYVPNNIFWFGTGYSMDSPFGEWRTNAAAPARVGSRVTCEQKDYVVKYFLPGYNLTFDVYIPFVVHPPARSISVVPSGLSCGTLTNNPDGSASMNCTVTGTGPIVPRFRFESTYGKFYYRYYDYRTNYVAGCYGNNIAMVDTFGNVTDPTYNTNASVPAGYQVSIPVKEIDYPLNGIPSNSPPGTPSLSCAASGVTGETLSFTVSGTDPESDQIRYGFDWVNAGSVNEWVPTSGYVTSGTERSVTHTWNAAGTYTVRALAEDTVGGKSAWAPCTVTITAPPPTVSCSIAPSPGATGQTLTMSSSVLGGSGNFSYSWSDSGGTFGSAASASKSYSSSGTKTVTLTVTDNGAVPTASVVLSPQTITAGQNSTLTWSSTNASSCTGTNFSTGGLTSGTLTVSPGATTVYSISCTGSGGSGNNSATLTVNPAPSPTASLTASPSSVGSGGAATLTWSSANTTSCTGTNFVTNGATNGSTTVYPLSTTVYSVSCSGAGGSANDNKTVTVVPAPTATLTASPLVVYSGDPSTITWSSTNASACTGTNFSTGGLTSGTRTVNPTIDTTYGVSCSGTGGTAVAGTTVYITTGGGGGGGGCFSGDTMVTLADGTKKPIRDVNVGDRVLAANDITGELGISTVTRTLVHTDGSYPTMVINGSLVVTYEHEMKVSRGGVALWRSAGDIELGDALIAADGSAVPVVSIEKGEVLGTVYNLTTVPHHTYFAGGVLVHNLKDGGEFEQNAN